MLPEFNVKSIDTRLSSDRLAHLCLYLMMAVLIAYYVLTKVVHHQFHPASLIGFGAVILLILIEAVSRFLPITKDWEMFNSGGFGALLVYNAAAAIIIIAYVPLFSPFLFITASVMFITIYYRGLWAYLYSIAVLVTIIVIYIIIYGLPKGNQEYFPILFVIFGGAFGGIIARAGAIDSAVRKEFVRISKSIEVDRQELRSLLNNMPTAVVAIDNTGNIEFYNSKATDYLILDQTKSKATSLISLVNKQGSPINIASLNQDIADKNISLKDTYRYQSNGLGLFLNIDISQIITNNASESGYILNITDITHDTSVNKERDQFVSSTYQELSTPISAAIESLTKLLNPDLTSNLSDRAVDELKNTYDKIIQLSSITNQLAMLSQAESNSLEIVYEDLDPLILVKQLEYIFLSQAEKKNLQLLVETEPNIGPIRTCKIFVEEILKNIISNAIKFTDHGTITIKLDRVEGDDSVIFSVKDTGVGISSADKDKVFNKYYKANSNSAIKAGAGIGLYLSNKLARDIGARMDLTSEINVGSTFMLRVPNVK